MFATVNRLPGESALESVSNKRFKAIIASHSIVSSIDTLVSTKVTKMPTRLIISLEHKFNETHTLLKQCLSKNFNVKSNSTVKPNCFLGHPLQSLQYTAISLSNCIRENTYILYTVNNHIGLNEYINLCYPFTKFLEIINTTNY